MKKCVSIIVNSFLKYSSLCIDKFIIAITLNKSPIKGNLWFFILLLFCIISSIFIRLDYHYNWLQFISFELVIILRCLAAFYSCFLMFMILINLKQFWNFIWIDKMGNKIIPLLYYIYSLFILFITCFIFIINYNSINLLNIQYLNFIFLSSSLFSLLIGLYFAIYYTKSNFNFNKNIPLVFKLGFIAALIGYISFIIALRYGLILELIKKIIPIHTVYCSSDGDTPRPSLNSTISHDSSDTLRGNDSSVDSRSGNAAISNISTGSNSNTIINNGNVTISNTTNNNYISRDGGNNNGFHGDNSYPIFAQEERTTTTRSMFRTGGVVDNDQEFYNNEDPNVENESRTLGGNLNIKQRLKIVGRRSYSKLKGLVTSKKPTGVNIEVNNLNDGSVINTKGIVVPKNNVEGVIDRTNFDDKAINSQSQENTTKSDKDVENFDNELKDLVDGINNLPSYINERGNKFNLGSKIFDRSKINGEYEKYLKNLCLEFGYNYQNLDFLLKKGNDYFRFQKQSSIDEGLLMDSLKDEFKDIGKINERIKKLNDKNLFFHVHGLKDFLTWIGIRYIYSENYSLDQNYIFGYISEDTYNYLLKYKKSNCYPSIIQQNNYYIKWLSDHIKR